MYLYPSRIFCAICAYWIVVSPVEAAYNVTVDEGDFYMLQYNPASCASGRPGWYIEHNPSFSGGSSHYCNESVSSVAFTFKGKFRSIGSQLNQRVDLACRYQRLRSFTAMALSYWHECLARWRNLVLYQCHRSQCAYGLRKRHDRSISPRMVQHRAPRYPAHTRPQSSNQQKRIV
jgi:hypothetical protein